MLGWEDDDPRVEQALPVAELLAVFAQTAGEDRRVHGALGEDGDDVVAVRGFGLWTENATNGVLRCWSRPVLVLK